MPTVARLNRSLPRARLYLLESYCKLRSEFFRNRAGCSIAIVVLEHEAFCGRDQCGVFRLPGDFRQRRSGITVSVLAVLVGRKINMPEAIAAREGELVGVLREPSF